MPLPKSGGKRNQSTSVGKLTSSHSGEKGPVISPKDGQFSISIQVKPGSKTNSITAVSQDAVSVQITAPPVDGEANLAIIKYFAEILHLKKTDVSLKGGKSRLKTVTVESSTLSVEKILELLKNQKE